MCRNLLRFKTSSDASFQVHILYFNLHHQLATHLISIRSIQMLKVIPLHLPSGDTSIERTIQIDRTSDQVEAKNKWLMKLSVRNPMGADTLSKVIKPNRCAITQSSSIAEYIEVEEKLLA